MSQKMMQTQVCKGSNHVRVISQEKQKSYAHTCTHTPSTYQSCQIQIVHDTSCIYVKTRDGKKIYCIQSAGIYHYYRPAW